MNSVYLNFHKLGGFPTTQKSQKSLEEVDLRWMQGVSFRLSIHGMLVERNTFIRLWFDPDRSLLMSGIVDPSFQPAQTKLGLALYTEFLQGVSHVGLYRLWGDHQPVSNLAIGVAA